MEDLMKIGSIALSLAIAFSGMSVVAMQGPTHYDILGVASGATQAEIKAAHRKLALKYQANGAHYQTLNDEEKKHADDMFKMTDNAYKTLNDFHARQQYDQFIAGNQQPATGGTHFAGRSDTQDHVMFLAGIFGAKKTYSYLTLAWEQYSMHKNFVAVQKHAELQLKNRQENKPITTMRDALDLSWVLRLRQGAKPSPVEQAIDQFDRLAIQNPQSLTAACPQLVKMIDKYRDAIGDGTSSVFKAAAIVGVCTAGYLTSDKWLPQLLSSKLFRIALHLFN